jgi:LacI family transcriptional regulator
VDCIGNDIFGGAKQAAEHLLRAGHRQLGYVRAKQRILNLNQREQGVLSALADAGEAPPVYIDVDISSDGAFRDFDSWLGSQSKLPDALFIENDILAAAVIRALKIHNIRIPEDISLIGFDNIPLCEMLDPPLSTVHLCKQELGSHAMDQLHRRICAGQVPHRMNNLPLVSTTLSTYLISRASVKPR